MIERDKAPPPGEADGEALSDGSRANSSLKTFSLEISVEFGVSCCREEIDGCSKALSAMPKRPHQVGWKG